MKRFFWQIRKKIKQEYGTIQAFAEAFGKTSTTMCKKLNGTLEWKSDEIEKACKLLHIPIEQVGEYFFCD